MSIGTLGLVRWNKDSGNAAAKYQRQTRNATRAQVVQNHFMLRNQKKQIKATKAAGQPITYQEVVGPMVPPMIPPGWYPDPSDNRALCWWDGVQWHPRTKHYQGVPVPPPTPQQPFVQQPPVQQPVQPLPRRALEE
ncbi:DUF2510 domain-containing protein [Microlunatus sp. GCM10028923]|uniref:DUF2510 domain-containing protein n=1 Tax=Microlunatus sp. GCM10028923 TaxID=3273400 RepID=UPI0036091566